jgi:hypothetical protein
MKMPRSSLILLIGVIGVLCSALAAGAAIVPAPLVTSATLTPSLSPNRLGGRGSLTLVIGYAGGTAGVPAPVRKLTVRFPAGLNIDIPKLRSCNPARLLAHGPSACPPQSRIGHGHALAQGLAGSQLITEHVALSAFIGPPDGTLPTLEILGQGHTPFDKRVLLHGTVSPSDAPYGEELTMSIPRIQTLNLEPDASLLNLSLTMGTSKPTRKTNAVLVPSRCPAGGFPFAAEFTYADGTTGSAVATARCPVAAARTARTISVNETGHLRLTAKHGFTLEEQGSASGTFKGAIYVRLTAVSTSRVTAEITIRGSRGSISGRASASYRTGHTTASFSGSMSITHGAGSYAHAHGSLGFSGTIQRSNSAITVYVSGRASA